MDDQIMESLAGFDALWQRVTAREEPPRRTEGTYPPERALQQLIHAESRAAAADAALARMLQGDGRALLLRCAAEDKRHLRRLRAEYFILTGLTAAADGGYQTGAGRLSCLREAYLRAGELARQYGQAREQTGCPELRALFDAFAGDERRRAQQLRSLLVESF